MARRVLAPMIYTIRVKRTRTDSSVCVDGLHSVYWRANVVTDLSMLLCIHLNRRLCTQQPRSCGAFVRLILVHKDTVCAADVRLGQCAFVNVTLSQMWHRNKSELAVNAHTVDECLWSCVYV